MDRHVGGKHVVSRPGTAYVCAIHDGETMQDALARFARDDAWCKRELGDVPPRTIDPDNRPLDAVAYWDYVEGQVRAAHREREAMSSGWRDA